MSRLFESQGLSSQLEMFKISVSKRAVDHPLRGVLAINVIVIFTLMAG